MSSGKAAGVQEGLFLRRGDASEDMVAVREAAEPADDVGVLLGVAKVLGIVSVSEQLDAAELVGQMLGMLERQIEKFEQGWIDPRVDPTGERAMRHVARLRVARKGPGVAAKHVAGKLVEHDDER